MSFEEGVIGFKGNRFEEALLAQDREGREDQTGESGGLWREVLCVLIALLIVFLGGNREVWENGILAPPI